jgi:hypothetical protein
MGRKKQSSIDKSLWRPYTKFTSNNPEVTIKNEIVE